MYSLSLKDFPYLASTNARKSLHYILNQRYKAKAISDANMDELLKVGSVVQTRVAQCTCSICVRLPWTTTVRRRGCWW